MTVQVDIPDELAGVASGPLSVEAAEALAVAWYRQGRITRAQLGAWLGLARFEVDGLLKRLGVEPDYTAEDVLEQVRQMREVLGR